MSLLLTLLVLAVFLGALWWSLPTEMPTESEWWGSHDPDDSAGAAS